MNVRAAELANAGAGPAVRPRRLPAPFLLLAPLVAFLLFFFVAPFVMNFLVSFRAAGPAGQASASLSLLNYTRLLTDAYYLRVIVQTFALGFVCTFLTFLLGYPCAYFIAKCRPALKGPCIFVLITPLLTSIVIRSYGWILVLGRTGFVNSTLQFLGLTTEPVDLIYNWIGVVIAVTHVLLPFMVLSIASVIEGIHESLEESAMILGANRWRTFRRVTFPLSLDGVATGAVIVFMLTIGSFVTVLLVGGEKTMVMGVLIYQQIAITFDRAFASSIGSLLLLISLGLLYVQARWLRVRGRRPA
jgi:putative spermidine/putrescine transport system permease protein